MAEVHPIPPHPLFQNLTKQKFDRLRVVSYAGSDRRGSFWNCVCVCGTTKTVSARHLKTRGTTSCGCWQKEATARRSTRHGCKRRGQATPEYKVWHHMRNRCTNPKGPDARYYHDRNVSVCRRWQRFENFLSDMGPRPSSKHSIERKNNNRGYCPSNCKWATAAEQNRNKRTTRRITFAGRTLCLMDWSERLGINYETLWCRIYRRGWSVDRALTTPVLVC